jgi:hypothetical protein
LSVTGAYSIWLGENGIVINNPTVHFGATTTAEINNGIIFLSVGIVAFAIFAILFFVKRELLVPPKPDHT